MKLPSLFERPLVVNGAVLGLATILFLLNLGHEPLWLDETYSAAMATHSPIEMLGYIEKDVHPPLYYLLLGGMSRIAGSAPSGLRLLSVFFGLGLVALGLGPTARLYNRRAGVLFSSMVMFSPALLCFAQETRMYSMAAFVVTGAALYGCLAYQKGAVKDFVLFGIFLIAAMYTHYFALLTSALLCVALLGLSVLKRRIHLKPLRNVVGIAILAYLPWLPSFLSQIDSVAGGFWIPPTNLFILEYAFFMPFSFKVEDIPYFATAWAAMGGILLLTAAAVRLRKKRGDETSSVFLSIGLYFGTLLAGAIVSFVVAPVLMPRYMVVSLGLFFLPAAVGISELKRPIVRYAALGLMILLMLPADITIWRQTFNGPFKSLSAHIDAESDNTVPVIHEDYQTVLPLWHRMRDRPHYLLVPKDDAATRIDDVYGKRRPMVIRNIHEVMERYGRAWLVNSDMADLLDKTVIADRKNSGRFELPYSFVKVTLEKTWRREQAAAAVGTNRRYE